MGNPYAPPSPTTHTSSLAMPPQQPQQSLSNAHQQLATAETAASSSASNTAVAENPFAWNFEEEQLHHHNTNSSNNNNNNGINSTNCMPQTRAKLHNYYKHYFGNSSSVSSSSSTTNRETEMDHFKSAQTMVTSIRNVNRNNTDQQKDTNEESSSHIQTQIYRNIPTFNLIESDDNEDSNNITASLNGTQNWKNINQHLGKDLPESSSDFDISKQMDNNLLTISTKPNENLAAGNCLATKEPQFARD